MLTLFLFINCSVQGCGYGCQLHHVVYCLILAYATERTLILQSTGWKYKRSGWEQVFLPISETCTSPDGETKDAWPGRCYIYCFICFFI